MGIESNNSIDEIKTNKTKESSKINELKYKDGIQNIHNLEQEDRKNEIIKDPETEIKEAEELTQKLKIGTLEASDIENNMTDISKEDFLEGVKSAEGNHENWKENKNLILNNINSMGNFKKLNLNDIKEVIYFFSSIGRENNRNYAVNITDEEIIKDNNGNLLKDIAGDINDGIKN